MPHLAHDVDLLQELGKLRRVGRDVAQDLDGNVGAAVGPAVEVAERARGDALVADDLGGVELEVVRGRGRAREGRGRDEAVCGVSSFALEAAASAAAAARGGGAGRGSPPAYRRQRSHSWLLLRVGVCVGICSTSGVSCSSGRRVGPGGRELREPLRKHVLELVRGLARPAVDDEDVEREAVERVEGVGLADVEVEVALVFFLK